ncbi:hypothetical protein BB382_03745 [Helicobacter pylori]|nr:hypothetical protein [Helicobacter pylori]PDW80451.1 hypothetical protein BB382_03745 [Helicobacter pylori]
MIVKNALSVLDFYSLFFILYSLFFILYSLFFILYSVSVAFLFNLFLTFLIGGFVFDLWCLTFCFCML